MDITSEFPKVFVSGKVTDETERDLCADTLVGWAMCETGNKPPENFGRGMVSIYNKLGVSPTEKNITDYAKEKGWLK